jgi:hypothetical protein
MLPSNPKKIAKTLAIRPWRPANPAGRAAILARLSANSASPGAPSKPPQVELSPQARAKTILSQSFTGFSSFGGIAVAGFLAGEKRPRDQSLPRRG